MKLQFIRSKKNHINILFLIIFALIQFPIKFKGLSIVTFAIIYGIPILYLIINFKWFSNFCRRLTRGSMKYAIAIFAILLLISLITPITHMTFEFSYITEFWRRIIIVFIKQVFLLALYENYFSKGKPTFKEYSTYYILSIVLYVAFTGLTLVSSSLRNFCINIFELTPKEAIDVLDPSYQTRFGWSGWSGFDLTIHCALGTIFCCINLLNSPRSTKAQLGYIFLAVIMLVGNMLYGRTGMITSGICLILLFIMLLDKKYIKAWFWLVGIIVVGFALLTSIKNLSPQIAKWYDWAFSLFTNFLENGVLRDNVGSAEHLLNDMYWMPETSTFLFGDGLYTLNGVYYMQTDSSVMRHILYYGFPMYALGLIGMLFALKSIVKGAYIKKYHHKKFRFFIYMMFLITICLIELKGEAMWLMLCVTIPLQDFKYVEQREGVLVIYDKCDNDSLQRETEMA